MTNYTKTRSPHIYTKNAVGLVLLGVGFSSEAMLVPSVAFRAESFPAKEMLNQIFSRKSLLANPPEEPK